MPPLASAEAVLNQLFLSEATSDLVLVVNGRQLYVHRCIVAESSDLIKGWIDSPLAGRQAEGNTGRISIKIDLPSIGAKGQEIVFGLFVIYLKLVYSLKKPCDLLQTTALYVAAIANYMLSPNVKDVCEEHLVNNLVLEEGILRFARLHSLNRVVDRVMQFLAKSEPLKTELIPDLDNDDIDSIFNSRRKMYPRHCNTNEKNFDFLIRYCLNDNTADVIGKKSKVLFVSDLHRFHRLHHWIELLPEDWRITDFQHAEVLLGRLLPGPTLMKVVCQYIRNN